MASSVEDKARRLKLRNLLLDRTMIMKVYSDFGVTCDVVLAGRVDAAGASDAMAAVASATCGLGVATSTVTWPRPVTMPVTVRFDCGLSTLTTSPSVPLSSALPRVVR